MNRNEVCGNCKYCRYDTEDDDWYCDNEDGDEYTEWVRYEYKCDDWEGK